jgi:hypothetical protein
MTPEDGLFNVCTLALPIFYNTSSRQTKASIIRDLVSAVTRVSPDVISNLVNSTLPIVASTLEKAGVFNLNVY